MIRKYAWKRPPKILPENEKVAHSRQIARNRPPLADLGSKKLVSELPKNGLIRVNYREKEIFSPKIDDFTVNSDTEIRRKRGFAAYTHENAQAKKCRKNAYGTPKIHQES